MDIEVLDHDLARLEEAVARAGRSLVQLETHMTWTMAVAASLEGETRRRRDDARRTLAELFVLHASLRDVIDGARAMRRRWMVLTFQRLERLDSLLHGTSIVVSETAVPVGARGLVAESRVAVRITPDGALAQMAGAFDTVAAFVADVELRWDGMTPRIVAARARLDDLSADVDDRTLITPVAAAMDELAMQMLVDPVSVDAGAVDAIEHDIARLGRATEAIRSARTGAGDHLAALRCRVSALDPVAEDCRRRHAHVGVRFTSVPPPPAVDPGRFIAMFVVADHAVDSAAWGAAADALAEIERSIDGLAARLDAAARAYDRLLADRDELRGRFEAYEAKVDALGVAEDAEVVVLADRIRAELWTAPTDLASSARMLDELQRAITDADQGGNRR